MFRASSQVKFQDGRDKLLVENAGNVFPAGKDNLVFRVFMDLTQRTVAACAGNGTGEGLTQNQNVACLVGLFEHVQVRKLVASFYGVMKLHVCIRVRYKDARLSEFHHLVK